MNSIYNNLLSFLPYYERSSKTFKAILKAIAIQIKERSDSIEDFINQLFIDTATWGLDTWEKNLGLDINTSLTYQERREIIKSKFRSNHHVSDLMIEGVIEAIIGVSPNVIFTQKGIIEISFNYESLDLTSNQLISMINKIKPTFFGYEFRIISSENINIKEEHFIGRAKYKLSGRTKTESKKVNSNSEEILISDNYFKKIVKYEKSGRTKTKSVESGVSYEKLDLKEKNHIGRVKYLKTGKAICGGGRI